MAVRDLRGGVEIHAQQADLEEPVPFLQTFVTDRKGRPIHLYPYQVKYLDNRPRPVFTVRPDGSPVFQHWDDQSKSRMVVKARQIGMSYISALEAMWLAMTVPGILIMFISIKQDQAEELLSHVVLAWNSIPDRIITETGRVFTKMKTSTTREQMTFFHSKGLMSRIISLPNSPGAARGWAADLVYWDEAAKFPHEQEMLAALLPTTARGGLITRLSTHRGTTTNFYEESVKCKRDAERLSKGEVFDLEMPDMIYQETPWWECNDPQYQVTVEKFKKRFGETSFFFQEEFCCIASDESVAMFTHNDLMAAQDLWKQHDCQYRNPDGKHKIVCGLDIGRVKDVTVLYAIEELGDYAQIIRIKEWAGQGFDQQLALVSHELSTLGSFYLRVDHTGMGMMLAEKLAQVYGSRVEGIDFTLPQKDALITETYVQIKDHHIAFPPDEDNMGFKLYNQLHNVRRERSERSFNAKYVQSEAQLPDDHLWSFCLAASQLTSPAPIQGTLLLGKKDTVVITEQSGQFTEKITPHKALQTAVALGQTPTVRIMKKEAIQQEEKDKRPERDYWRNNIWDAPKTIAHKDFEKTNCPGILEWQGKLGQADQYVCNKCFCNAVRTRRK